MKTLKQLNKNLKDGYEVVNLGKAGPQGCPVWIVTTDKKYVLPKRFDVAFFIQEATEMGLVK